MIGRWMPFITAVCNNPWVRHIELGLCYLAILLALIAMYSKGDYIAPSFVYQHF